MIVADTLKKVVMIVVYPRLPVKIQDIIAKRPVRIAR
jgi:hypothetical protein